MSGRASRGQFDRSARSVWSRGAHLLARTLGAPLSRRHRFQRADAIVVLGASLRPDGRLSRALEERVLAGVGLWRRGGAPILCVTGGGPSGMVEADAMAERALQLGVPRKSLRIERESVNTGENARFVAKLLAAEECRTIWIVSQPFHLLRARLLFRKFGLRPLGWHADNSLQFQHPRLALRWIVREYAALAHFTAFEARALVRGEWRADQRLSHRRDG